jgi:hypothetical protein
MKDLATARDVPSSMDFSQLAATIRDDQFV